METNNNNNRLMNKPCKICGKNTAHSADGSCTICESAKTTANEICDRMGVCRQAVYTKAERKGINKRYFQPPSGKKYLVFTEAEAKIIVDNDNRYKEPDSKKRDSLMADAEVNHGE